MTVNSRRLERDARRGERSAIVAYLHDANRRGYLAQALEVESVWQHNPDAELAAALANLWTGLTWRPVRWNGDPRIVVSGFPFAVERGAGAMPPNWRVHLLRDVRNGSYVLRRAGVHRLARPNIAGLLDAVLYSMDRVASLATFLPYDPVLDNMMRRKSRALEWGKLVPQRFHRSFQLLHGVAPAEPDASDNSHLQDA